MISFIVIGRNEGWKLSRCLESVIRAASEVSQIDSEIIYFDSNSSDDSVGRASQYPRVKTYCLTADYNSPIARNVGAGLSKGTILFFIDGDMEIEAGFLKQVINMENDLCYGFVSGYYINMVYDENWNLISSNQFPPQARLNRDYLEASTGGLFIISRQYWELAGGMKNYLYGGADPDLAFRLAAKGVYKLRKTHLMALHHTQNISRRVSLKSLLSRRVLTGRILLYRENLTSVHALRRMLRNEYSAILLSASGIAAIIQPVAGLVLMLLYMFLIMIKLIRRRSRSVWTLLAKDLIFLFGLVLYWPDKGCTIAFEEVGQ